VVEQTEAAPAEWPSYSDLAKVVQMSVSGFGRYVATRLNGVDVREIGREKRVSPGGAIGLLEGRGLPRSVAEREVFRIVKARRSDLPVLHSTEPSSTDADLLAELRQRYEEMLARMRQPEFDRRMREAFTSPSTENMSRAAVALARKRRTAGRNA
jgi:hypothetical protein